MLLPSKMRLTEETECSRFASGYDLSCAPRQRVGGRNYGAKWRNGEMIRKPVGKITDQNREMAK